MENQENSSKQIINIVIAIVIAFAIIFGAMYLYGEYQRQKQIEKLQDMYDNIGK